MSKVHNVLVTGATSGLGEGLARSFLDEGAVVGVCGRNGEKLFSFCQDYPKAKALQFDVTDAEAAAEKIGDFIARAGGVDLAILNAGDHKPTDGANFSPESYARLMNVNYIGTLNCLAPVIAAMRMQGCGVIAITGSLAGYAGLTHAGAYCASKSAVMRLAETLRAELRGLGIDVRLISPGFVKTPLTDRNDFPMPFLLERDDAVRRIRRGLRSGRYEIAFPRRLQWSLRLLSALPKPLYFRVLTSMLRDRRDNE